MFRRALVVAVCMAALSASAVAEWSLGDSLDKTFAYSETTCIRMRWSGDRYRSGQGILLRTATPTPDGGLKLYKEDMTVDGTGRPGQFLLSGQVEDGAVAEFVVHGGTALTIDYGLCDYRMNPPGSRFVVQLTADGASSEHTFTADERVWKTVRLDLPKADLVRVRLTAYRLFSRMHNWTATVVKGDGRLGTVQEAEALSEFKDKLGDMVPPEAVAPGTALAPSPHRVEARPGYDILFYRGKPFFSYAAKGHKRGYHMMQPTVGINTYYVEGHSFTTEYWPEGRDQLLVGPDSPMIHDLILCQRYHLPYKTAVSMAHCTPFLPAWMVKRENLGFEGHRMRRGRETHASIFKRKTARFYKKGIEEFTRPLKHQPAILVFGQEEVPSDLDDYSLEAKARFRSWLRTRFKGDFAAFLEYVGGVEGCEAFERVPYPEEFEADATVGWPRRLAWLKLIWIQETYGDFLAEVFRYTRELVPGVPLTQRYVYTPWATYASRRAGSDYNYTFGHLTTEGLPNGCGVGRKMWSGIHAHAACLPLPRGHSIGKTWSRAVRRGAITDEEWRINAFTGAANGACGFEYQPFFRTWGSAWSGAALYTVSGRILDAGETSNRQMAKFLGYAPTMMHYEETRDVAVFHDAAFNSRRFAGPWSQSKSGIYTLIRETGYHADVLTQWDMTEENLRSKKVVVLAGTTSIAPEIQEAIRAYVKGGGTVVAAYCADGAGFPGCNSYAYGVAVRESAAQKSFQDPKAVAHLGDVLGIYGATGPAARKAVTWGKYGDIPLEPFNEIVAEGKWAAVPPCVEWLNPLDGVKVLAKFDDGTPAVFSHAFGKGRAVVFAFDIGQIANNVTWPPLWQAWCDVLTGAGCRKSLDTGNFHVEGGAWHDDSGRRIVFLVNHDARRPQTATLSGGRRIDLAPNECRAVAMKRQ